MNCPIDKSEMQEGRIGQAGDWDATWHSTDSLTGNLMGWGAKIMAWRCSKCGKVELMTEVENKKEEK